MGIIFAAFLVLLLIAAFRKGAPAKDFLSREMTTTINGYFLTTVFMTHFIQYLSSDMYHASDWIYIYINRGLGQLIVAMFLFYSGYGVMESIKNKPGYIRSFPVKRMLIMIIDFEIAAVLYLGVSCMTGQTPTLRYTVKAFFAWESLGNSNWYVFAIMYLYLVTYLSFRFLKENRYGIGIGLIFLFGIIYILFMKQHKGGWWYDTILCYGAGMLFSLHISRFRRFFTRSGEIDRRRYNIAVLGLFVAFGITYFFRRGAVWRFELLSILFALLIVMITMKFRATSPIYSYIGKNLFVFYIYQRIPMIFFKDILGTRNIYLYFVVCIAFTIAICMVMIPFYKWLHHKIFQIL